VDAWTFLWLMLFLKIPVAALFLIVRWAVRQAPETMEPGGDGGIGVDGPRVGPRHPHRPRRRPPRPPRRGAHGEPAPLAPPRVRTATARARLPLG
jgi:hypothetical protein